MKCLDLTDIERISTQSQFEHLLRVDHLFISSKVDNLSKIDVIKSMDIKTAIDLKHSNETSFDDEREFLEAGIGYIHFPFTTTAEFDFERLQKFGKLISRNKNKTLVYCMSGDRAGALLALNACLICGHPKKRALEFGEKIGMNKPCTKASISNSLEKGRIE